MKFMKVFVITLLALFLTGCYTQLQYSQTMKKITDKETNDTPAYSWSGEEQADSSKHTTNGEVAKAEKQEEYIPVYYKDYKYATKYGNVYNFYANDWYDFDRYHPYSSWYPFGYDRWAYHSFYGRWYDRPHYGFSFSLSWGWPHYHYGYYDPFYDPYYDYYWHRYHNRYTYGYWNYYGKSGYGHGYYPDKKVREDRNVRYGPRSIGTNRVVTDRNRSGSVDRERSAAVTNRTSSTVRTRSTGTTRTRGTSRTTRVDRSKSDNGNSTGRSRTRGNARVDEGNVISEYNYRSRDYDSDLPLVIDEDQLKQIRSQANRSNNRGLLNRSRSNNDSDKSTFFNRMRSFFDGNNDIFKKADGNRSTWRTRSNFPTRNRGTVNRSSSNNRSSVTRSKSSSSNSRSRGSSSSSSRSRSGGSSSDSDSGSDRSRGN
ncbi:hypothetical protein [Fodinibius sp. Rm-B-1B1-1]|uniref:hypothetical protein n=1 Tax=Fodinibius alkaliphilus TaxID=3140241 RepID=UPI00315A7D37